MSETKKKNRVAEIIKELEALQTIYLFSIVKIVKTRQPKLDWVEWTLKYEGMAADMILFFNDIQKKMKRLNVWITKEITKKTEYYIVLSLRAKDII